MTNGRGEYSARPYSYATGAFDAMCASSVTANRKFPSDNKRSVAIAAAPANPSACRMIALPRSNKRQRGTALIFSLVMLLLLTILGITAVTTSSLQEKMAGNMRDQYMAQEAGDSILRDGEGWVLFNLTTTPTPACPPPGAERVWNVSCLPDVTSATDSWWSGNGYLSTLSNTYVSQEPRYVVEQLQKVAIDGPGLIPGTPRKYRYYYRATGWSVGASDYARGLFQSVFSRRSDEFPN